MSVISQKDELLIETQIKTSSKRWTMTRKNLHYRRMTSNEVELTRENRVISRNLAPQVNMKFCLKNIIANCEKLRKVIWAV